MHLNWWERLIAIVVTIVLCLLSPKAGPSMNLTELRLRAVPVHLSGHRVSGHWGGFSQTSP